MQRDGVENEIEGEIANGVENGIESEIESEIEGQVHKTAKVAENSQIFLKNLEILNFA